jgi:hypothetical protein
MTHIEQQKIYYDVAPTAAVAQTWQVRGPAMS